MSHKAIESYTFKLNSWRPFLPTTTTKSLDTPDSQSPNFPKRPCFADRITSFTLDMSKLCLIDDESSISTTTRKLFARKRRRRGSRSVSGRSSDRSGTRRCCSVATCSDFNNVAIGTDSSGELFVNGDGNWGSDDVGVGGEAVKTVVTVRKDKDEKESSNLIIGVGLGQIGVEGGQQGNESGYGSEPGYRGDAEFGYGDEFDEEEDDQKMLFWGDQFGATADTDTHMGIVGENSFSDQKAHHRFRRKKHDWRMVDPMS